MGRPAADGISPSRALEWPGSLSLLVELPAGECIQARVTRYPFVIGRLDACDLTLRDNRISRRHARIRLADGAHVLEDLNSRHGITVNGRRVRTSPLAVGDRVGFGVEDSFAITICDVSGPEAPLLKKVSNLSRSTGPASTLGRLAAALDVARTMEAAEGVGVVFEAVVEAALSIAGADRAFLLLRDEGGELVTRLARGSSGEIPPAGDPEVPLPLISDALDRRGDLFSMSIGRADSPAAGPQPGPARREAVCVPILRMRVLQENETSVVSAKRDTLGVLYMNRRRSGAAMAESSRALLQALAIEISTVLENARLIEEEREKRRLEQEIRMAREIQRALLPPALPREGWLVARGHCEPSSQLGGDYYDLMQIAPDTWAGIVADVSGKGAAASILASMLQGAFFLGSGPGLSLPETLGRINRYLCERFAQSRFVTVFALIVSADGSLRWSNAGHCAALLVRSSGAVERLPSSSAPLGVLEGTAFAERNSTLRAGDKLVVYSDGVSERSSPDGEQYGERRLAEAAGAAASLGTADFFDALLAGLRAHAAGSPQSDDLTLLALGYRGA